MSTTEATRLKGETPQLSASMRRTWLSCPRKVFYRYIAGVEPKRKGKALCIGTAFHAGLEAWRKNPKGGEVIPAALAEETMIELAGKNGIGDALMLGAQVRAYVLGYILRFGSDDQGMEQVEAAAFDDGDGECGFIDSLSRYGDGLWIVEDKTTSRFIDPDVMRMALRMDDQVGTYMLAYLERGYKIEGVKYRQTLKTATRQTQKESPADYRERITEIYREKPDAYREFEIRLSEAELLRWRKQKERQNLEILSHLDIEDIEQFPINSTSCIGTYGPCEYVGLCVNGCDSSERKFKPRDKLPVDGGLFQERMWS